MSSSIKFRSLGLQSVLLVYGLLIYVQVVDFEFLTHWDDGWQVQNFYSLGGLSWENIKDIFSSFYQKQYSPLNQLSYTILYSLFGWNPVCFHWLNLCWHLGTILLMYHFIRLSLKYGLTKLDDCRAEIIAFCAALLMAIHPVQVESVVWISASKVLFSSFLMMGALVVYLYYRHTLRFRFYLLALCLFFLSFFCKEHVVVFPFLLLLVDWWWGVDMKTQDTWLEKVPFFMLAVFFGFITLLSLEWSFNANLVEGATFTFVQRIVFACYAVCEYLIKLIFPTRLLYLYPFPMQPGEELPFSFWVYPISMLLLIFFVWIHRKNRLLVFGSLFFMLNLLLVLHIVPMPRIAIVADRYLYLACAGFFMPITAYLISFYNSFRCRWKKVLFVAVTICYIGYLCGYTYTYSQTWRSNEELKKEVRGFINARDDANAY